jgi:hypothetical protein
MWVLEPGVLVVQRDGIRGVRFVVGEIKRAGLDGSNVGVGGSWVIVLRSR